MKRQYKNTICLTKYCIKSTHLLRIIVQMALFLDKTTLAAESKVDRLETLLIKTADIDLPVLQAICSVFEERETLGSNPYMLVKVCGLLNKMQENEKLTNLNLSGLDITEIPVPLLRYTKHAKSLNLSGNPNFDFNSKVINRLYPQLVTLDVRSCYFTSSLFISILKSGKELKSLRMANNPYINFRSKDFRKLRPQLEELDISDCNIDQDEFEIVCDCPQLKILKISNSCKISFDSPKFNVLCYELKELDVSGCDISAYDFDVIYGCPNLKVLKMSNNPNVNFEFAVFESLDRKLESLDVSNCNITNLSFWTIFKDCCYLKNLSLANNPNISFKSEEFKNLCTQLVELDVSKCNIDEETFGIICNNCSKLEVLKISNNPWIKFCHQKEIKFKSTLKELRIDNCDLSPAGMLEITTFKCLQVLDISGNYLPEFFGGDYNFGDFKATLKEFYASKVGMKYKDFYKIRECLEIRVLDISNNDLHQNEHTYDSQIKRIFQTCFNEAETLESSDSEERFSEKQKKNLTSLNISRANLSISQLNEILDFFQIEKLDCSCNDFSGIDDTFEIGNAKWVLKDANFSNCYISSPKFLREVFDCPCLAKVDLSKNNFGMSSNGFTVGSSAKSLQWLDISESHINHSFVMKLLDKFEKIEYLDLSNNNLNEYTGHNNARNCSSFRPVNAPPKKLSKSLRTVKISHCGGLQNNADVIKFFKSCENLEYLDASRNNQILFLSMFQYNVSFRSTLKYLDLSFCNLNSADYFNLATGMEVLETLNLNGNFSDYYHERFKLGASKRTLKTLSLRNCPFPFNSLILEAISKCSALETLDLTNSFIPSFNVKHFSFGSAMSSLRKIQMGNCGIKSEIFLKAVTNCSNLQELDLSNNNFSNISSNFTFGLSKHSLKILKMDRCKMMNQKILEAIMSCDALQTLSIAENSFRNFSFGISKHSLKELNLRKFGEFLDVAKFDQIFEFPKLEKLDISGVNLKHIEQNLNPEVFSKSTLRELIIADCGLTNPSSLKTFTSFPELEKIDISRNYFENFLESFSLGISKHTLLHIIAKECNLKSKSTIRELTDCEKLKTLILRENRGLKEIKEIEFAASAGSLQHLDFENCDLDLLIWIDEIKRCPKIRSLNLSNNNLSDSDNQFDCDEFQHSLQSLDLSNSKMKNQGILNSLTKYHGLESLKISYNKLDDLNSNFDFGNLVYTLNEFVLDNCLKSLVLSDPGGKDEIMSRFKFLTRH